MSGARVVLRDGSCVTVRRSSEQDEPALRKFLAGLGLEARRTRYFTGAADLDYAAHLAAVTDARHGGLVALDASGAIVADATYAMLDEHTAEVAVELVDDLHGRGLGTILIERLAELAESRGVRRFSAVVLPDNREMLDVFRDGFDARVSLREGVEAVQFPTAAWRLARERFGAGESASAAGRPAEEGGRPSAAGRPAEEGDARR